MRDILAVIGGTLIVIFSISMCNRKDDTKIEVKNKSIGYILGYEARVIVIDSCEYIVCGSGYGTAFSHKGNCRFCSSRQNKK